MIEELLKENAREDSVCVQSWRRGSLGQVLCRCGAATPVVPLNQCFAGSSEATKAKRKYFCQQGKVFVNPLGLVCIM